jgi:hypothetical protein
MPLHCHTDPGSLIDIESSALPNRFSFFLKCIMGWKLAIVHKFYPENLEAAWDKPYCGIWKFQNIIKKENVT